MLFAVLFQDFAVLWEYLGIGARTPQENVGSTTADNAPRAGRREWTGLAPAVPALLHGPDRFRRYMPEEQAQGCVIAEWENLGSTLVLCAIRPDRWLTFDFSDEVG
jgi:hypothetical protein